MKKIIKKIFSITNENNHKILTVCGIKLKFNRKVTTHSTPSSIEIMKLNAKITERIIEDKCPLCGCKDFYYIAHYNTKTLIERWEIEHQANPFDECYNDTTLVRQECTNCNLHYYNYRIPDTVELYEKLYLKKAEPYAKYKWEYDITVELVKKYKPNSVLDIGCGYGFFLEKIKNAVNIVEGCEYNPDGIKIAKENGYTIHSKKLTDIKQKFDMITSFQVLEHIKELPDFLTNCLELLNTNGFLVIAVPNPACCLIKHNPGILELPPHHCQDFTKQCLEWIANKYNLTIVDYIEQDLEFWVWQSYMRKLYNYQPNIQNDYSTFLKEQENLTGKTHLICLTKNE